MQYLRYGIECAIVIITALITLHFAPATWRVSGVSAVFVGILAAELIYHFFSKPFWVATRKAATCSCNEAMKEVARLPKLLYNQCGKCGAEMA